MNGEYNGWQPQINYSRTDSDGNPGLWEWSAGRPDGRILWSGRLLGYRPPELTPEEFLRESLETMKKSLEKDEKEEG